MYLYLPKKITAHSSSIKKYIAVCISLACVYALCTSAPYYRLGDIFFGQFNSLYNVRLAQFFYTHAAHPLIGMPAPYAYHQLSRTYFIQGDLIQSIHDAKEELVIYPDHTATYYIIGLTYGYLNNLPAAGDAFSHYIDTHNETWAGRNDLAWLQFRAGDVDGALTTIAPAYIMYPDNPWVANTYGVLLMNKKNYKKAYAILTHGSQIAQSLTESDWGHAYPGNDPRIYSTGLNAMKQSFSENLSILATHLSTTTTYVDKNTK